MILDTSYPRLVLAPQVLGAGFDEIFFPEISLASVNRQNCDCSYLVDLLRCLNSLIFFFLFSRKRLPAFLDGDGFLSVLCIATLSRPRCHQTYILTFVPS